MGSNTDSVEFMLRDQCEADLPFVYNSFLKSYRDSPTVSAVPNTMYYEGQHALVERLLLRPACKLLMAVSREDQTQIFGYALAEILPYPVMHWIYVKHPFRSFGIGKALEDAFFKGEDKVFYTHRLKTTERLLKNRANYVFNPFILHSERTPT